MPRVTATAAVLATCIGAVLCGAASAQHLRGDATTSRDVAPASTARPIIGILTLPNHFSSHKATSYFPASYVKWLESGGGRVVPIPYDAPLDETAKLLSKLNGVLFTGGGTSIVDSSGKLTQFGLTGQLVYRTVQEAHANGETFPLWATCLGFEMLNVVAAGDPSVLSGGFDSENLTLALNLEDAASSSRLLGSAPKNVVDILTTQTVTMNNHQSGVTPAAFTGNANLTANFNMLSTNKDRNGKEFVSTIEGKSLPIFATQWHPEKVQFEWNPNEVINHSTDSVTANSYPTRFFLSQARMNSRAFPTAAEESEALIYNYNPVYTEHEISDFEQCYFFDSESG